MPNQSLTDLTERSATADTDLIHVNSGGTDYKETKANFLSNITSSISSINSSLSNKVTVATYNLGANSTCYLTHAGSVLLFTDRSGLWSEGTASRTLAVLVNNNNISVTRESANKLKITSSFAYATQVVAFGHGDTSFSAT